MRTGRVAPCDTMSSMHMPKGRSALSHLQASVRCSWSPARQIAVSCGSTHGCVLQTKPS